MQKFTTCLMFVGKQNGKAQEAIKLYTSLFKNSKILRLDIYGRNESGTEGTVKIALFSLGGQEFMALDSNGTHNFTFTPAVSIFVQCDSERELDELYAELSKGGEIKMPLADYGFSGFSKKFGWIDDRFGVSWQLNLS